MAVAAVVEVSTPALRHWPSHGAASNEKRQPPSSRWCASSHFSPRSTAASLAGVPPPAPTSWPRRPGARPPRPPPPLESAWPQEAPYVPLDSDEARGLGCLGALLSRGERADGVPRSGIPIGASPRLLKSGSPSN